nr:uncharacterized protein LOC112769859 [Arachis hypogaea]
MAVYQEQMHASSSDATGGSDPAGGTPTHHRLVRRLSRTRGMMTTTTIRIHSSKNKAPLRSSESPKLPVTSSNSVTTSFLSTPLFPPSKIESTLLSSSTPSPSSHTPSLPLPPSSSAWAPLIMPSTLVSASSMSIPLEFLSVILAGVSSQSHSSASPRSSRSLPRRLTRVSSLGSSLPAAEATRRGCRLLRCLPWGRRRSSSSGFGSSPSPWTVGRCNNAMEDIDANQNEGNVGQAPNLSLEDIDRDVGITPWT